MSDELTRLTRRGFITMGVAAAAGYGAYKWLRTRPRIGGLEWPMRRVLELNESITQAYFNPARLSPEFQPSAITRPRVNGHLGLVPEPGDWKLHIEGIASLTLDEIKSLPAREMITELRCIEGWSIIVKWTGTRFADLAAAYPPKEPARFVAIETPGRGYYVGLDMPSAMHPQTLLAWAINDQPLNWHHGAPLRLAIPIKYGIKSIKRVGTIRYTNIRPADFWAERGYDWYAGH
jgi:DMSO/TMAO reductase YedYZ molybdopterin-dependent catalytic subunit